MKVIVTGHLGYIGPTVVKRLKAAGYTVTGVDPGLFEHGHAPMPVEETADETWSKDARELTAADLHGYDAIVHLAALSNDPMGALDPSMTYAVNFKTTNSIARAAKAAGVSRFVFSSSCSLYGASGGAAALNESAEFSPQTEYARSKVEAEQALFALNNTEFSVVSLRNATAFGVGSRMRLDLVVSNLTAWALTTGEIRVMSDGTPWRPLVHIDDIALAIECCVKAPAGAIAGEAFNIGIPGANYQVKDVAQRVAQHCPNTKLSILGKGQKDNRSYKVDFSKAITHLPGYVPSKSLDMGILETIKWIKETKINNESLEGEKYIRLQRVKALMATNQLTQFIQLD